MSERARNAAERLRHEVQEHADGPDCRDASCLLHAYCESFWNSPCTLRKGHDGPHRYAWEDES